MKQDAILDLSATDMIEKIRKQEVSVKDVIESHINRIKDVDPQLNAVVISLFEEAMKQAIEADKAIESGKELGPLHGVPITIKAQFDVLGTETNVGVPNHQGRIAKREGPLVSKLREAGAIILGKTNIMMSLSGWETDNPIYGRTNNPWDLDRTPGGSSGGESAIIAARGSPWGLTSDFGGSTRVPAHFCGLHSFKPTSGLLTNSDLPPHLFSSGQNAIIPQPGPMARHVVDLKLMMDIFTNQPYQRTGDLVPPIEFFDPEDVSISDLTIGFYTDNKVLPVSPAIKRATEEAVKFLESKGATIKTIESDAIESLELFVKINAAGGDESIPKTLAGSPPIPILKGLIQALNIPKPIRPLIAWAMERRGQKKLARLIRIMKRRSSEEYWRILDRHNQYREEYLTMLDNEGIDIIVCPPTAIAAPYHGSTEYLLPYPMSYAIQYNVLGMPAGVVSITRVRAEEEINEIHISDKDRVNQEVLRCEKASAGMPVGVQIVGHHWRDHQVLKVMEVIEQEFKKMEDYPLNKIPTLKVI